MIAKTIDFIFFIPELIYYAVLINKKLIADNMNRQGRPLQNSMLLQDSVPQKRMSNEYTPVHGQASGNMSKSMMYNSPEQYKMMSMVQSPQHRHQNFQNFFQDRQQPQQNANNLDKIINGINERLQKISKTVDSHDIKIKALTEGELFQRIISEIKESIPLGNSSGDIGEHLFNIKLDIKAINEEISRMPKFTDLQRIAQSPQMSFSSSTNTSSPSKNSQEDFITTQMLKKRDDVLQKILHNIESEISLIKKNMSLIKTEMKVSPISSSSCIMLKYQELLKARTKAETDIIINQQTYYIDNEGYLLDCNSRYIIDQKGKKVRLEEKHLAMLRSQKILH